MNKQQREPNFVRDVLFFQGRRTTDIALGILWWINFAILIVIVILSKV